MPISPTNRPYIFITMGDPSGIGPEIIMKSLQEVSEEYPCNFVVIGDRGVMSQAARSFFSGDVSVLSAGEIDPGIFLSGDKVSIVDPGEPLPEIIPGVPSASGTEKAVKCLDLSVELIMDFDPGASRALVTAPVNKQMIAGIIPGFVGHTEYLCEAFSSPGVTMALIGEKLCAVPVTRHIPVKEITSVLNTGLIERTLEQVIANINILSDKEYPVIGVCALNPHCGEGGKIGMEEIDIIIPAIEKAKHIYPDIRGPISSDVIFYQALKGEIDVVISMYHDQGLAPFKMVDFDNGVNMTLGLGYIRTSPDHGTAYDIAGKGIASSGSMEHAIKLAVNSVL